MKAKTIIGVLASVKGVVAVLAFFGIVSTASAEVVYVTYTGTVSAGYDQTGIFGRPNSSLDGDKYTASYIFDTSVGVIQNVPSYNSALGGYAFSEPQPSPSLGAILTIDGVSVGFGGGALGQIYGADYGTFTRSYANAADYGSAYNFYTYNFVINQMTDPSRTIPVSITEPFTYKAKNSNGGYGQGSFQIVSNTNGSYLINTYASLVPTTVSMSLGDGIKGASAVADLAAGVPEPSTWAMMLIGFAGLGFTAYRRTRKAALAAA